MFCSSTHNLVLVFHGTVLTRLVALALFLLLHVASCFVPLTFMHTYHVVLFGWYRDRAPNVRRPRVEDVGGTGPGSGGRSGRASGRRSLRDGMAAAIVPSMSSVGGMLLAGAVRGHLDYSLCFGRWLRPLT